MEERKSPARLQIRISAALVIATALAVILFATQCAAAFQKPELQFRAIRINSIGIDGASLDILVDVYNPNAYGLGVERLSYDLMIENVHWGVGSTDLPIALDAGRSTTVRLPLQISWSRLGDVGRDALRTGSVNYGVSGEMMVATSIGSRSVPFSKSGRFSVLTGQESADPEPTGGDPTAQFRVARYWIETATPFSNTTRFPTFL
jgi:LEA14-like dessication related protein